MPPRDKPQKNVYDIVIKGNMLDPLGKLVPVEISGIAELIIQDKTSNVKTDEPPIPTVPPLDTGTVIHDTKPRRQ